MQPIDAHAHLFTRPFFEALARQSPLPGDVESKLADLATQTGIEIPPADVGAHLARWIETLDAEGVEHMVAFASLPEEIPAVAEAVQASRGRLTGVAIANPRIEDAPTKVEALLAGGAFRGVLLFPAMHHVSVASPEARGVLEALARHRGVCYVHCGMLQVPLRDRLGLPRPYDLSFANPLDVIPAANAFGEVTFVLPHFGAGLLREALIAGAQCANVVVDTSSSNAWTRTNGIELRDVFARALDVLGAERVLFGTDSGVFPAGWRRERYEEQQAIVESLAASAAEREAVFGGNARRILGLGS